MVVTASAVVVASMKRSPKDLLVMRRCCATIGIEVSEDDLAVFRKGFCDADGSI